MSTLEITENEFLIKLDRKTFNLSFVRSLLKMVEVANPTADDLYTPEKHVFTNYSSEPGYFSSLDEK
jgi:hypothetical protein